MKRALLFAGLVAATLASVGCNKEVNPVVNSRITEIVLNNGDTRTVNDGVSTRWENDDALNVFYAVAGTTDYSQNNKFTVDDASTNHATDTADLTASSYDWYLLFPYESQITTPVNSGQGCLTVGSAANQAQIQTGPDDMGHLAGKNLPVFGIAKDVPVGHRVEISMKHVTSVVAVNLTNATDQPLTVNRVSFTAPEDIIGTYYIDFSSKVLGFKESGANDVSNTATLEVAGGGVVAAGSTTKFYLAIKPFQAKAEDKLVLKVEAGDTVIEKEVTLPTAVKFDPGHIKNLNLTHTGGPYIKRSSLAEILTMSVDEEVHTQDVLVVGKHARGIMLAQDGTYLLAYDDAGVNAKPGDIVTVEGKIGESSGLKQIDNPVVTVVSSNHDVILPDPKVLSNLDDYASDQVELIQYTGTMKVSGSSYYVEIDNSTRKGSIQYPIDSEGMAALDNKTIIATGFFTGLTESGSLVGMMSTSLFDPAAIIFDVTPRQINVTAATTSATFSIRANAAWTVTSDNAAFTVSPASGDGNATVRISFSANQATSGRVAHFTATCPDAGVSQVISLTQAGAIPQGDGYTLVFGNKASNTAPLNSLTKASAAISSGTDYVTTQPFTVNVGNAYYGDAQNCIRIGKSGVASKLTIELSDLGKVTASRIAVKCKKHTGAKNENALLTVNGSGPQSPAPYSDTTPSELVFNVSSPALESLVFEGTAAILIYSITVIR